MMKNIHHGGVFSTVLGVIFIYSVLNYEILAFFSSNTRTDTTPRKLKFSSRMEDDFNSFVPRKDQTKF